MTNGTWVHFNGTIKTATGFPQVIITTNSFKQTLWTEIVKTITIEGHAMYNSVEVGLTFWALNVNIFRDPHWVRGQETPGKDPLPINKYVVAYARGFQGEQIHPHTHEPTRLMLFVCCNHFTNDLDNWNHNF